jgi:hypothetical protein
MVGEIQVVHVDNGASLIHQEGEMTKPDTPAVSIHEDLENHAYVAEIDGERAGLAVYHLRGDKKIFVHTEVDPSFGRRGVGSALAKYALDDTLALDQKIVPLCPFIAAWIGRHPEYQAGVDQLLMDRLNHD